MKPSFRKTAAVSLFGAVLLVLLACMAVYAEEKPPVGSEYRVKAGFIYHFARFTQWPPEAFSSAESPIIFCLAASGGPEINVLMMLNGKRIRGRRISVRKYIAPEDAAMCHILYIASDDPRFVAERIKETEGRSVLTIGDIKTFIRMGGIIRFFIKNEQLRFAVNLETAEKAMLKFSSQLLMSAEIIQEER